MSADVVEQLRSLTRSFDEFVGEVTADEVMEEQAGDERRDQRWTQVAAAVIVLALIGGLAALMQLRDADAPSDGGALSGAALADALVDRVWVAIDYPLPQLPFMRLSDGDGSTGVELVGSDGCNDQSGPFRLDGNTVAGSQIGSTAVGCSTPRIAGVWDGTTMTVDSGTLTVTDSSGTSTRWLPLDALSPIAPNELVGTYTMGTAAVSVTPDAVITDDCTRSWVADGPILRFTGAACTASAISAYSLLNPPEWTSAVGDEVRVVVQVDGRFVRLDRTDADAPTRPGLASFLGAIGDRTWVYDAPSPDYPFARRPSLRPPTSWDVAGGQLVAGFDGCNTYALNGSWTASGEGWQVAVANGGGTSVGCGERPTVAVTNGSVLSLTPDGLLSVAAPDGTEYLFRDIRATTFADMMQSPVADMPGRWELDPGVLVDIKLGTSPDGIGVITFGTCGVNWWPTGNEWIGAGPVPADCVPPTDSPSAAAFLQLLDAGAAGGTAAPVERPITVGVNPERDALYLANGDGSIVLRLTRLDTDPAPPTDEANSDVIVEDALTPGAWLGARTNRDDSAVLLFFIGAAEYQVGDPCTARYVATATESDTEVRVAIHSERSVRPEGAPEGCRLIGYSRSLTVQVGQQLGDRDLVVLGDSRGVFDGSTLVRPGWIPDGWVEGPEQPAGREADLALAWSRAWAPPHPEPADGACVPGASGFVLFEGPAGIADYFPLEVGETQAGAHDINGSSATYSTNLEIGITRLIWTSNERGYVLRSSPTCAGDEPPDLDTMLRFARALET